MRFVVKSFEISPQAIDRQHALDNNTLITLTTTALVADAQPDGANILVLEYYFGGTLKTNGQITIDAETGEFEDTQKAKIELPANSGLLLLTIEVRVRALGEPDQQKTRKLTWVKA